MGLFEKIKPAAAEFGNCCKDLKDAMTDPPASTFRIDHGVLYLAVGYAETPEGYGWFEQTVLHCPFCGAQLQTKEEIARKIAPSN